MYATTVSLFTSSSPVLDPCSAVLFSPNYPCLDRQDGFECLLSATTVPPQDASVGDGGITADLDSVAVRIMFEQPLPAKEESAEVTQLRAQLKVTGLESTIAEKDHELSDLGASSSSLKSQNQSLVNQVHELEISSADLREKLEIEGLTAGIEHGQAGRCLTDLEAYIPSAEDDFNFCYPLNDNYNPDSQRMCPENAKTPRFRKSGRKIDASAGGGLTFS
ncbi:hypothetical protein Tco_1482718 [Tanacetum coccineum]